VSKNVSRKMEEGLVFMLGTRGTLYNIILWAAGIFRRQKLEVQWKMGRVEKEGKQEH
jgi:hypothetical protein